MNRITKEGWRLCLQSLTDAVRGGRLEAFLEILLTEEEIDDLSKRCLILAELKEGRKTQRQIAADIGVSLYKVSRGAHALEDSKKQGGNNEYHSDGET